MRGRVMEDVAEGVSVLLADGMPAAPSGKDYELWYRTDGEMVPAGVFEPDEDGTVRERLDAVPEELVGVTLEPEGGSAEPTLPMIAEDLRPSASTQLWIVDVYSLVLAALLVMMGSLGDRVGRRLTLIIGATGFARATPPEGGTR